MKNFIGLLLSIGGFIGFLMLWVWASEQYRIPPMHMGGGFLNVTIGEYYWWNTPVMIVSFICALASLFLGEKYLLKCIDSIPNRVEN